MLKSGMKKRAPASDARFFLLQLNSWYYSLRGGLVCLCGVGCLVGFNGTGVDQFFGGFVSEVYRVALGVHGVAVFNRAGNSVACFTVGGFLCGIGGGHDVLSNEVKFNFCKDSRSLERGDAYYSRGDIYAGV